MTGHTASVFGFKDRGILRTGAVADITIFDPKTVLDLATFEKPTTPSDGIEHVIVGGEIIFENGRHTGARAGKMLRRDV